MADNVGITTGSDATIATDDTGTEHVQVVKLAYSANGSKTHIAADGDGLSVAPPRTSTAAHTVLDDTDTPFGSPTPASDELIASNSSRLSYIIQNTGDVAVFLGFGTAALVTTGFELGVGASYGAGDFTGAVNAIPASDTGGQEVRAVEFG